jgi:ribosomal protein L10
MFVCAPARRPRLTFSIHHISSRSYALSVNPPKIYPSKPVPRVYTEKKRFRYHQYARLLEASSSSPLIFLHHNDFTAQRLIKLRRDITAASNRFLPPPPAQSLDDPSPTHIPVSQEPSLSVLRTAIFGVALREFTSIDINESAKIAKLVSGPLAVLTLPSLHPPQLNGILRALERLVPPKKPKTEEQLKKELEAKNADPATPGRRMKRIRPTLTPELNVVGALIEGKIFTREGVDEVGKLPTLGTLREQLVGLISSPGMQLAGVLSEAGGGRLARTLEGLKKGLEENSGAGLP